MDSGVSPDRIGYLEPIDEQVLKNPGTTDESETEKLLMNSGALEVDRLRTGVLHARLRHPSGA